MTPIQTLAQTLVRFHSTQQDPEQMQKCMEFCIDYLKDLPLTVKKYEHNGFKSVVFQVKESLHPEVVLLGHIDVIPGDPKYFQGEIRDDKLYSLGSLDMKVWVATLMEAFRDAVVHGRADNLALILVTDEEIGGNNCAKYLVNEVGYRADVVIVPDGGAGIKTIVNRTKHIMHFRFDAGGKESHACEPWLGTNAIMKLLRVYTKLHSHFREFTETPTDTWVNTINLGMISGGVATNEVPHEASMNVDIRFTETITRDQLLGWIDEALEEGVQYTILAEGQPTYFPPENPYMNAYFESTREVIKHKPQFIHEGGGTDGRFFAEQGSVVIVHQGDGGNCQSNDEYVELSSIDQVLEIQKKFLEKVSRSDFRK